MNTSSNPSWQAAFGLLALRLFAAYEFLESGLEKWNGGKLVCRYQQPISLSIQFVVGYGQLEFGYVGGTGFACAAYYRLGNAAVYAGIDGCDGCRMVCGTCRAWVTMCATTVIK